jgi:hypothetical protein
VNPNTYIFVAEKLVEAFQQMEQIIDRLITAHDEARYWLELNKPDKDDKDPF